MILLLIFIAVSYGVYKVSRPVHGSQTAVEHELLRTKPAEVTMPQAPGVIDNDYLQLTLPAGYQLQSNQAATPGLLFQQTIIKPSAFGSLITSIGLKQAPEGGLAEDSGYQLRSQQTGRYRRIDKIAQSEPLPAFVDTQTGAVVAFWQHGSLLATIGVSMGIENLGDDSKAQLSNLNTIVQAWHWKR